MFSPHSSWNNMKGDLERPISVHVQCCLTSNEDFNATSQRQNPRSPNSQPDSPNIANYCLLPLEVLFMLPMNKFRGFIPARGCQQHASSRGYQVISETENMKGLAFWHKRAEFFSWLIHGRFQRKMIISNRLKIKRLHWPSHLFWGRTHKTMKAQDGTLPGFFHLH